MRNIIDWIVSVRSFHRRPVSGRISGRRSSVLPMRRLFALLNSQWSPLKIDKGSLTGSVGTSVGVLRSLRPVRSILIDSKGVGGFGMWPWATLLCLKTNRWLRYRPPLSVTDSTDLSSIAVISPPILADQSPNHESLKLDDDSQQQHRSLEKARVIDRMLSRRRTRFSTRRIDGNMTLMSFPGAINLQVRRSILLTWNAMLRMEMASRVYASSIEILRCFSGLRMPNRLKRTGRKASCSRRLTSVKTKRVGLSSSSEIARRSSSGNSSIPKRLSGREVASIASNCCINGVLGSGLAIR